MNSIFLSILLFRFLQDFFGAGAALWVRMQHVGDELAQPDVESSGQSAFSAGPSDYFAQIGEQVRSDVAPKRHDASQRPNVRRVRVFLALEHFRRHVNRRSGDRRSEHVIQLSRVQKFGDSEIGELPNCPGAFLRLGVDRDAQKVVGLEVSV